MTLETDYLIVGSGAVGMAFADTLLAETDANIIIVDRYAKPGGHWNVAYPFVTLHQPSQFYGVTSKELSKGRIDQVGLNKGYFVEMVLTSIRIDEVCRFLLIKTTGHFLIVEHTGHGLRGEITLFLAKTFFLLITFELQRSID